MNCANCGKDAEGRGWSLNNYYGITGYFCGNCYDKVSHNSYKKPDHPNEYVLFLLKQRNKHG